MSDNNNQSNDFEPQMGTDEWVEQYDKRKNGRTITSVVSDILERRIWILGLLILGSLVPLITTNAFIIQVAGDVVIFALLALGLHIVAGYSGLLDLGFAAFFGVGAYTYAYLSAELGFIAPGFGLHFPSIISIVLAAILGGLVGLLLGSVSLRLSGDYLAIATLGFGLAFVNLLEGMTRVNVPFSDGATINLTNGTNGIPNVDDISFLGFEISTRVGYYWLILIVLVITLVIIYNMNQSPLGRAWRSMREDELATQAMGMDVRALKLRAFAIGAAVAAISGAIFAARQGSVFPANFDTDRLIVTYATIVLGGMGSLPGVILGALIMNIIPPALQSPFVAGLLFYGALIAILLTVFKPRWQGLAGLAGAIVFGFVLLLGARLLAPPTYVVERLEEQALDSNGEPSAEVPTPGIFAWYSVPDDFVTESPIAMTIRRWLLIPEDVRIKLPWAEAETDCSERRPPEGCLQLRSEDFGNYAFVIAIFLVFVLARVETVGQRVAVLIPTLYLMIMAWELRLSLEPSVTRKIFIGLLLVILMIYRPNGLLGTRRVEVV